MASHSKKGLDGAKETLYDAVERVIVGLSTDYPWLFLIIVLFFSVLFGAAFVHAKEYWKHKTLLDMQRLTFEHIRSTGRDTD